MFGTERKKLSIGALEPQLWPAIKLRQFLLLHDDRGFATTYLSWAFLSEEVSRERLAGNDRLLHLSEWNEGAFLWIMDLVAVRGGAKSILRTAFDGPLKGHRRVHGLRYNSDGSIRRSVAVTVRAKPPALVCRGVR
jgi:hemolysin-activating ACP:hemolysin acyltransferase